ncbi:MAG: hypothetical protein DMG14_27225 [Acidobacteria bacterium]|nr:MAG: hypothetical protein DMG14_27225 [Acidobacteriota bacterium]
MIDEVLVCEVFLCHRAVELVLVSDVAVQIDLCRHHRLARQVDALCARRYGDFAAPAHTREQVAFGDERGVLDRRTAVTGNEAGAFKDGDT